MGEKYAKIKSVQLNSNNLLPTHLHLPGELNERIYSQTLDAEQSLYGPRMDYVFSSFQILFFVFAYTYICT